MGPYTFESYGGKLGVNAIISTVAGKKYFVSVANLVPYRGPAPIPNSQPPLDDDASMEEISRSDFLPPPGVTILE